MRIVQSEGGAPAATRPGAPPDVAEVPSSRWSRSLARTFDSLTDREFRWFYISMLGQMAAMNMQLVVRGYLAFVLTGSYAALGFVSLAGALPMLLLSPLGGVFADRKPRRTILQAGQFVSMLNAASLAILSLTGTMEMHWLIVSAMAHSATMAMTMPARQSMIPDIVGNDRVMNAVSLNMAGMNTMRLFAPAVGGFIVGTAGFGWAFAVMAALFGLACVSLAQVAWQPAAAPAQAGERVGRMARNAVTDIWDGLRYIVGNRLMFALLGFSFLSAAFAMPYQFLLPGYAADIFDGGGVQVGLLMSISAVGALVGALALATNGDKSRGVLLFGGSVLLGVGLILFALTDNFWVAGGFLMIVGLGSSARQALSQGLIMAHSDDAYRGRVMAVFMTQVSVMQLGTFFTGAAAEFIGIKVAFIALGTALIATSAVFYVGVPSIRRLR